MAVYFADKLNQNNAERATGVAVKTLRFSTAKPFSLVTSDIITIGTLPRQSLTTGLSVIVDEDFDGTTPQFVLGFYDRTAGTFTAMTATIVLAGAFGSVIRVPLIPIVANINADGTAYTGTDPLIVNDDQTAIAIQWTGGATSPTVGECSLILHHDYYGTATAKYGLDNTPLTVYE